MTLDFKSIIKDIYEWYSFGQRCYGRSMAVSFDSNMITKYMEFPVDKEEIELPTFAVEKFLLLHSHDSGSYNNEFKSLVIELRDNKQSLYYKSADPVFRETHRRYFPSYRLSRVQLKPEDPVYYFASGSIFDADFKPIVLFSWILKKDDSGGYNFIKPVFRIRPDYVNTKGDGVKKLITNRLFANALNLTVSISNTTYRDLPSHLRRTINPTCIDAELSVAIIIDDIPYTMSTVRNPSIETTNEELLQTAFNYVNDIV